MGKTPLELAANETIKDRILANLSPEFQAVEYNNKEEMKKGKMVDTRINKKGQIYHPVTYDPPLEPAIVKKPKKKRPKTKNAEIQAQPDEMMEPQQSQAIDRSVGSAY